MALCFPTGAPTRESTLIQEHARQCLLLETAYVYSWSGQSLQCVECFGVLVKQIVVG